MPNLLKKVQFSCQEAFRDKLAIAFMALVLVVAINHLVFSFLLLDRERARAFTSSGLLANSFTTLGDQTVFAGTNDVVLAEFFVLDAWGEDSLACNYNLTGNPCISFIDGNGADPGGTPGTADDGANYFFDIEPNGMFSNSFFQPTDGLCTNSLDPFSAPVTCLYLDTTDGTPCTDGSTLDPYLIGAGCALGLGIDNMVPTVGSTGPGWVHFENPAGTTGAYDLGEDIWFVNLIADDVLQLGSDWNNPVPNQWQGDAGNSFVALGVPGAEGFIDLEPTNDPNTGDGIFSGQSGGGFTYNEPSIIDLDGDSVYSSTADTLLDADGGSNATVGTNSQIIPDGATLTATALSDSVCLNTLLPGNIIIYVDGNNNCIPGDGGVDVLIRDDTATLPLVVSPLPAPGLGTFPYTFLPMVGPLFYYDNNPANGAWDAGSESLWVQAQGLSEWNTNDSFVEADGTGSLGTGADDDGLSRGGALNLLVSSDNVCLAISGGGTGIVDIYVDQTNDCIPINDPGCVLGYGGLGCTAHTQQLFDQPGDGLNPATTFNGLWASAAGILSYNENVGGAGYDYGAGAALTESLWMEINFLTGGTYTSTADIDVFSTFPLIYDGDPLSNFIVGPSGLCGGFGCPVFYADADSSGTLTATDTILEDIGNVQTGTANNGVIDRQSDIFNRATLVNSGTLSLSDLTNLRFKADLWYFGGDGHCDASDSNVGTITTDSVGNLVTNFTNLVFSPFYRGCVVADIPQSALGGTVRWKIPQLVDNNSNGLYEDPDQGWFSLSGFDGPTGGDILAPDTFTINPLSKRGSLRVPTPTEQEPAGAPMPSPIISLPAGVEVGDLIRVYADPAVYLVTAEGKLRIFPNELVYFSYYPDFSKVKYVSQAIIDQIPLGKNVTLRAGTYLMKTPVDDRVYAVEPSGVARWLETEEIIKALFGLDWAKRVVDMPEVFFADYFVGESISSLIHPTATLLQYAGMSEIYYIEDGQARLVTPEVFAANGFLDKFVVKNVDGAKFDYTSAAPLSAFIDFFMAIERNLYKPLLQR